VGEEWDVDWGRADVPDDGSRAVGMKRWPSTVSVTVAETGAETVTVTVDESSREGETVIVAQSSCDVVPRRTHKDIGVVGEGCGRIPGEPSASAKHHLRRRMLGR
jgi:hypothetical protein